MKLPNIEMGLGNTQLIQFKTTSSKRKSSMATISISDLCPTGSDLFSDSESFMNDLIDGEIGAIQGGGWGFALTVVSLVVSTMFLFEGVAN
jgi:hypothetical protein